MNSCKKKRNDPGIARVVRLEADISKLTDYHIHRFVQHNTIPRFVNINFNQNTVKYHVTGPAHHEAKT